MNRHLLRQAQELQSKLAKAQDELSGLTVEASVGGGAVKIVMTGQQQVQGVKIDPEVLKTGDAQMVEDLVLAAFNEALEKSRSLAANHLSRITGGLKIPGLG